MKILVIDGQGGGVGRTIIEQIKLHRPAQRIIALGTNVFATSAMLRAGAESGATGENAIRVQCERADCILGPIGIVVADALMGEVTREIAAHVGSSPAQKILVPVGKCSVHIAGIPDLPLAEVVDRAVRLLLTLLDESDAERRE